MVNTHRDTCRRGITVEIGTEVMAGELWLLDLGTVRSPLRAIHRVGPRRPRAYPNRKLCQGTKPLTLTPTLRVP